MKLFERFAVWMGGYRPSNLKDEPVQDREPIAKIGGAVLLAAAVATVNWGVAGWLAAPATSLLGKLLVALAFALTGFGIVVSFDRGMVYFIDTAAKGTRSRIATFLIGRIVVVLIVGSITAQAIVPFLMGNDLRLEALKIAETSEKARAEELKTRFKLGEHDKRTADAKSEVERLDSAAKTLPADIQAQLAEGKACWVAYGARRSRLVEDGKTLDEARSQLRSQAAVCVKKNAAANAERDRYFGDARAQLVSATKHKEEVQTAQTEANSTVKTRLKQAAKIERDNLTANSSTVLWSLILSSPAALFKWALITTLLLILELWPLLLKLQAGQSLIGKRISQDRAVRSIELDQTLESRSHDSKVAAAVCQMSLKGVDAAMQDAQVQAEFTKALGSMIASLAPAESVRAMMSELATRGADVNEFKSRFPQYAAMISEAWAQALVQTSRILSQSHGPIPGKI